MTLAESEFQRAHQLLEFATKDHDTFEDTHHKNCEGMFCPLPDKVEPLPLTAEDKKKMRWKMKRKRGESESSSSFSGSGSFGSSSGSLSSGPGSGFSSSALRSFGGSSPHHSRP